MIHVENFTNRFFRAIQDRDTVAMTAMWEKDGKAYLNGMERPLSFLTSLPPFVELALQEVHVVHANDNQYLIQLKWVMGMPDSVGYHDTYLTVVRRREEYLIVAMVDFGIE